MRLPWLPAGARGWLRAACALLALAALALGGVLLPGSPAPVLAQTASGGGPPAPTGVTAEPVSTTTIALTWSAPRDSGRVRATASSRRRTAATRGPLSRTSSTRPPTATPGLTGGTTRHYRVYSLSIGAIGEPSAVALTATHVHVPDANLRAALGAALAIRKTDPVILGRPGGADDSRRDEHRHRQHKGVGARRRLDVPGPRPKLDLGRVAAGPA